MRANRKAKKSACVITRLPPGERKKKRKEKLKAALKCLKKKQQKKASQRRTSPFHRSGGQRWLGLIVRPCGDADPKSQAAALNSKQTASRCSPINGIVRRTMSPGVGVAAAVLAPGLAGDRCSVGRAEVSRSTSFTASEQRAT